MASSRYLQLGYISISQLALKKENDLKINRGGIIWPLAEIFGIKYGIRNILKISNPLNTKYLVGCVAPPIVQSCSTISSFDDPLVLDDIQISFI